VHDDDDHRDDDDDASVSRGSCGDEHVHHGDDAPSPCDGDGLGDDDGGAVPRSLNDDDDDDHLFDDACGPWARSPWNENGVSPAREYVFFA
jgi:hypothetical protein